MSSELVVLAVLSTLALLSMLVYVIGDRSRLASRDTTGRGGSFFLGYFVRNWFYWFIAPARRLSLGLGLIPLFFNLLAVACGLASLLFFAKGHLPAGGWMILLSGFADVMDGEVARSQGVASREGAFLDSTLDRFSEFFAFIGLGAFFWTGWPVVLVLVALGGSLLVSYTRARGESLGVLCKKGLMQRAERMLLLGFGAILDPTIGGVLGKDTGFLLLIILSLIALGTVATSIYRTVWIARELRRS